MTTPNFTVTTAATNGAASINATTGAWSYTPNADFNGNDAFTVSVTDDDGNLETQVISISVSAVADIADDTATTNEDTAVTTNVLTNDSEAPLSISTVFEIGSPLTPLGKVRDSSPARSWPLLRLLDVEVV